MHEFCRIFDNIANYQKLFKHKHISSAAYLLTDSLITMQTTRNFLNINHYKLRIFMYAHSFLYEKLFDTNMIFSIMRTSAFVSYYTPVPKFLISNYFKLQNKEIIIKQNLIRKKNGSKTVLNSLVRETNTKYLLTQTTKLFVSLTLNFNGKNFKLWRIMRTRSS